MSIDGDSPVRLNDASKASFISPPTFSSCFMKNKHRQHSLIHAITAREYAHKSRVAHKKLFKPLSKHLDKCFNGLPSAINSLREAIDSKSIQSVKAETSALIYKLFDMNNELGSVFAVSSTKRLEREVFVVLGTLPLILIDIMPYCYIYITL